MNSKNCIKRIPLSRPKRAGRIGKVKESKIAVTNHKMAKAKAR